MSKKFLLEAWEKKQLTVEAESIREVVDQHDVPGRWTFESVREEGQEYEDRLTSYNTCCLCLKPMLGDKSGPVDQCTMVKDPLFGGTEAAHEHCAAEKGEERDPCNEMWRTTWSTGELQQGIQKNLHAALSACSDLVDAVQDDDLAESKKMLAWLESQTRGLRQMIGEAETRKISLSA
jgi:hypothetical protein